MAIFIKNYWQDNRAWFRFTLKWFGLAIVIGALAYLVKPELINQIIGIFESKFGPEPARDVELAKQIFLQNSIACLLALAGGIIFGISSFLIVFFNGFIIGFVVMLLLLQHGSPTHNLLYVILGLAPHGILELPAFLLASTLGMRLGLEWLAKNSVGQRFHIFKQNIVRALFSIPFLAVLLLVAAFVEVFVSGSFVSRF